MRAVPCAGTARVVRGLVTAPCRPSSVEWIQWPTANAPGSSAGTTSDSPSCGGIFDLDTKRDTLSTLEARMGAPEFWDNQERAQRGHSAGQDAQELDRAVRRARRRSVRERDASSTSCSTSSRDAELSAELDRELARFERAARRASSSARCSQGPDDLPRRAARDQRRRRRHRGAGLGADAACACTRAGPSAAASRWRCST